MREHANGRAESANVREESSNVRPESAKRANASLRMREFANAHKHL